MAGAGFDQGPIVVPLATSRSQAKHSLHHAGRPGHPIVRAAGLCATHARQLREMMGLELVGSQLQLAQGIPRAAISPAASGGRTVEPMTEEDF
jgi:hypothetical protein